MSKKENLNFYTIDDKYIGYVSKYDKHIAYNKENKRPYVGIIFEISGFSYFSPMFSPKKQHELYKENLTFFKMYGNNKSDYLGLIKFADMIPVPKDSIQKLEFKNYFRPYNMLLVKQYNYINIPENRIRIKEKAKRLYEIINSGKEGKTALFYKGLCCNFRLLEEKMNDYLKKQWCVKIQKSLIILSKIT